MTSCRGCYLAHTRLYFEALIKLIMIPKIAILRVKQLINNWWIEKVQNALEVGRCKLLVDPSLKAPPGFKV